MITRFGLLSVMLACIDDPKEETPDTASPDTSDPSTDTGEPEDSAETDDTDTEDTEDTADPMAALEEAFNLAFSEAPSGVEGMSLVVHDAADNRIVEISLGNVTPQTRMPIASASKLISTLVFLHVIQDGDLSFSDTTGDILGWTGDNALITLDHLGAFTSGLPRQTLCTLNALTTLSNCVGKIAEETLLAPPGDIYTYGPNHQHVAAEMVQTITGDNWAEVFEQTLKQPLGLTDPELRYVTLPQQELGQINPLPAGGLISTTDEYMEMLAILFHRGQVNNGAALSESLVDRMLRNDYQDAEIGYSPIENFEDYDYRYGWGTWLMCDNPDAEGRCPVVGSAGMYGFTPWVDLEYGYYAAIAMDAGDNDGSMFAIPLQHELMPLIEAIFETQE